MNLSETELQERIELVRAAPALGPALLVCAPGKGPTCELCRGRQAPIVGGRHLNPEKFCEKGTSA